MTVSRSRAEQIAAALPSLRVVVVGDLMLDRYIYGTVRRISPEAPVPVVQVVNETSMPGGASNVAWNIRTLGGQADVAGIIGADTDGQALTQLLQEGGVATDAVLAVSAARTTVKTRIIAERQQVVRVDWERALDLSDADRAQFLDRVRRAVAAADGVIIEDYGKGVLSQAVVDTVLTAAAPRSIPVGYDPKDDHAIRVQGVTVATPNLKEAYAAVGREEPVAIEDPLSDAGLLAVGNDLLAKWGVELLMITLGPAGMLLLEKGADPVHVPTRAREVFDVSGAGDTVIATVTLAMAAGASYREAAELANYAAGVVVAQVGTAPCTAAQLLEAIP